ncbi:hypothetical protein [Metallosphaera javensis (ex Sakai et al. 2022)]|uniref:hypothetical protein n=1 Tax=Metallosphaera javensis (ex Sakai et al. 2022) TaxID=2775498 RepID=UPI002586D44A|nr:MAG: hypothetical protein MjAS7_2524 [Metallosphaera javensis (ex Sakai et al. 2022)]
MLDFVLAKEEDARSYWRLFARVWRKFNFKLVVADMVRSVDSALELSGIDAKRQLCLNHVKRRLDRDEREEVDLLLSGLLKLPDRIKELVERGLLSFTSLPKELQRLLSTTWWSPSTGGEEEVQVPHAPQTPDRLGHRR